MHQSRSYKPSSPRVPKINTDQFDAFQFQFCRGRHRCLLHFSSCSEFLTSHQPLMLQLRSSWDVLKRLWVSWNMLVFVWERIVYRATQRHSKIYELQNFQFFRKQFPKPKLKMVHERISASPSSDYSPLHSTERLNEHDPETQWVDGRPFARRCDRHNAYVWINQTYEFCRLEKFQSASFKFFTRHVTSKFSNLSNFNVRQFVTFQSQKFCPNFLNSQ